MIITKLRIICSIITLCHLWWHVTWLNTDISWSSHRLTLMFPTHWVWRLLKRWLIFDIREQVTGVSPSLVFLSDLCSGWVQCVWITCPPSERLPLLSERLGTFQTAGFTAGIHTHTHTHTHKHTHAGRLMTKFHKSWSVFVQSSLDIVTLSQAEKPIIICGVVTLQFTMATGKWRPESPL